MLPQIAEIIFVKKALVNPEMESGKKRFLRVGPERGAADPAQTIETGKNRGLVWIASSAVAMEGCQRKSIWTEHSTPRSALPLSQPRVFPGLCRRCPKILTPLQAAETGQQFVNCSRIKRLKSEIWCPAGANGIRAAALAL